MKNELKSKQYKRNFEVEPISTGDTLEAVLDIAIKCLKKGRPAEYADTAEGLEDFKKTTIDYFQYVKDTNANPNIEKMLVPDIEALCTFLGITRVTLLAYEKQRDSSWQDFIKQAKNAICAAKKELAFHQQIPPVVFMFDACNNHNYVNTSECKVEIAKHEQERPPISASEFSKLLVECERASAQELFITDNQNEESEE